MKQNIRQWLIIILNEQTVLLIFIPSLVIFKIFNLATSGRGELTPTVLCVKTWLENMLWNTRIKNIKNKYHITKTYRYKCQYATFIFFKFYIKGGFSLHIISLLNPIHGEVYSIQHNVIKFVNDLRQVSGFLRVLWFPPPIKLKTTL